MTLRFRGPGSIEPTVLARVELRLSRVTFSSRIESSSMFNVLIDNALDVERRTTSQLLEPHLVKHHGIHIQKTTDEIATCVALRDGGMGLIMTGTFCA